jgi:hypothetical protein
MLSAIQSTCCPMEVVIIGSIDGLPGPVITTRSGHLWFGVRWNTRMCSATAAASGTS